MDYEIAPGADLRGADLQGEILREASLIGANLKQADLRGTDFEGSNFSGADLTEANLEGAHLWRANFSGANLAEANLGGACLNPFGVNPGANFSGANLTGANLTGAGFEGANLTGANLTGANLGGARLTGANLRGANLKEATLSRAIADNGTVWPEGFDPVAAGVYQIVPGANLKGADLTGANLKGANLKGADLTGADLTAADLTAADLTGADLTGADLTGADLTGADLTGANLARANLERANFKEAKLERADLRRANLARADLVRADLTGANLKEVDVKGADLRGANLEGANLKEATLSRVIADNGTVWPEGFNPVAAGVYQIVPGANLTGANLARANLVRADLKEAKLERADLRRANLARANLVRADLTAADLRRAWLTVARLEGANLEGANLKEATLSRAIADNGTVWPEGFDPVAAGVYQIVPGANLKGANLTGANLAGARLEGVNLKGVKLIGADLTEANLRGADLEGAHLWEANLTGANLEGANLKEAKLTGANLTGVNVAGAISNEATTWPDGWETDNPEKVMTLVDAGDIWDDWDDLGESSLNFDDPWNSRIHTADELTHVLLLVMFKDWTEAGLHGSDQLVPLLESGFPIKLGGQSVLPRLPVVCLGDFLLPSVNEGDSVPEWFCLGNWGTKQDLDPLIQYDGFARWRHDLLASRESDNKNEAIDPLSDEFGNFWTFGQPRGGHAGHAWGLVVRIGTLLVDLRWWVWSVAGQGPPDFASHHKVIRIWNEVISRRLESLERRSDYFGFSGSEGTRTVTPFVLVTWCGYDGKLGLFAHDPVAPTGGTVAPGVEGPRSIEISTVPDQQTLEAAVVLLDLLSKPFQTNVEKDLSLDYDDWRSLSPSPGSDENLRYYDEEALYLLSEALEPSLTEWFGASEAGHGPVPVIPMRCLGDFRNRSRAEWRELFEDQWCPWDWRTRQGLDLEACYLGLPFWQDEMLKGDDQLQDPLSPDIGDFWMFGQSYANMAGEKHGLMVRMGSLVVDLRWIGASEGAVVIDAWNRMFEEKIVTSREQDYSGELKGSPFVVVVWDPFREASGVYVNGELLAPNERVLEIAFSLIDALPPQPGINPLPNGDWEEDTTPWRRLTSPPTPNESNDAP